MENNQIIVGEIITEKEAEAIYNLEKKYLESYIKNKDKMELKEWLVEEMKQDLPEKEEKEISTIATEIIETIELNEKDLKSLREAKSQGMSNEQWLSKKVKESTQNMEINKVGNYLQGIDDVLRESNTKMFNEITTKSGEISLNRNLDGFIAEQFHANTFNQNAVLEGSKLRAEALTPDVYGKNSFDIVIKDEAGKIVHQYQAKYGATAQDTIKYIKEGNYNNQRIIVPAEQVEEVRKAFPNKSISSTIGGTETVKITSKELTKEQAKILQENVQSGKTGAVKTDWNHYEVSDLARNIGQSAAFAGITSAGITAGFDIAAKIAQGKEIEGAEVIETALKTGADTGVKAAVSGAIKVASEKGLIAVIPKGTPAGMIANVVHVGIENIKIISKIASGELTAKEGLDQMGETTTGIVGGIIAGGIGAEKGAIVGALAGSLLGPVGTAVGAVVGGFVGGTVGYIAGSEVGKGIGKVINNIRDKAVEVAKGIVETGARVVENVGRAISSGIESAGRAIASLFGW